MPAVLLGLGYLLLAAAGAAAWGLALARSVRSSRAAPPPARVTSLLVAGALVLLAGRWVIVGLLAELDTGFIQEKAFVGLPISTAASLRGGMGRPGVAPGSALRRSPRCPRSSTLTPVTAQSSMNSSPNVSNPR